ncbi:Ni/Fe hydrogenase subunit alpha [Aquisalimonas sp.]|uniref:Ni/Fe hydrogenase subunit alpha n=1 Tax=Aquisalimonas sp. TaxID=1872621 RepID=UPI0025C2841D|nr:Ni/Fe hydrogenase subunit alpha [Aquisalimonas sp.]
MTSKTIKVDYIARVEGEGALYIKLDKNRVEELQLRIFEPPRFFEAFLEGRDFREAPDITARICGICPVAYLMSACHAMEWITGDHPDGAIRELRRLLYCGEWIESHVLHIYMLHAPDFLGYPDAITLAKDHPELVKRALRLKKIGNQLMTVLGGREIHPINIKVGGFYKAPTRARLEALVPDLEWALEAAKETVRVVAGLPFPDFEQDYDFMALHHPDEYPFNEGRLVSSAGLDLGIEDYDNTLIEEHVAHSTSLHSNTPGGSPVHLGPLARYALNRDRLHPGARQAADAVGLGEVVSNPFKSIIVRAVEVVYAVEEALRIIRAYNPPAEPALAVTPRAGTGYGATEAPRGICYHRYTINAEGIIENAKIVAPTSVNQSMIESDLREYVQPRMDLPEDQLRYECEQAIRNYDPCISCSCHFLDLTVERT